MKRLIITMGAFLSFTCGFAQKDSLSVNLNDVRVVSSRTTVHLKNIPQKIEILTPEKLDGLPSDNLAEALKRATNIDIIQYPGLSASIGMRGFAPQAMSKGYVLLLVNGIPLGTQNLASLDLGNIEKVEVLKGTSASLYGSQAMGGVINLITKTASMSGKGNISLSAGSFGALAISGGTSAIISDKVNFGVSFSRRVQQKDYRIGSNNLLGLDETEKLMLDKKSFGDRMLNSAWELNSLSANLNYKPFSNFSSSFNLLYSFGTDIETPGTYWGAYGYTKKDLGMLNLSGNLQYKTGQNLITLLPYFTIEKSPSYSGLGESDFKDFESTSREYGIKLQDNYSFHDLTLTGGIDYGKSDYSSERFKSKGIYDNPYRPDNYTENVAGFAQLSFVHGSFAANAGARYDFYRFHTDKNDSIKSPGGSENYSTFNPSAGISYTFLSKFRVHSSVGTGFLIPDAYKVAGKYVGYYNYEGNPDLKPEESVTWDAGITADAKNFSFDLTFFSTNYKNKIIDQKLASGARSYTNAQTAKMSGLEISGTYDFGALADLRYKLEVFANFTFLAKADFDETLKSSKGADSTVTRGIQYVRKTNGNFGVLFNNSKGFSVKLTGRYMGQRLEKDLFTTLRPNIKATDYYQSEGYTAKDKILQHPDFMTFDINFSQKFSNNLSLGFTISNLFDENYTEKDGYNMPGRQTMFNVKYLF
jgi:vitamin B12 transporter